MEEEKLKAVRIKITIDGVNHHMESQTIIPDEIGRWFMDNFWHWDEYWSASFKDMDNFRKSQVELEKFLEEKKNSKK